MMEAVTPGAPEPAGSAPNPQHLQLTPLAQPGPVTEINSFMFEAWGYLLIPDVLT